MEFFCFHWKSGLSNPLVERIYSIVALRTLSNELLPKRRVLIKTVSYRSRRLLSILSIELRRVCLSIIYVGQWKRKCAVDSIPKSQLQNGFKESYWLRTRITPNTDTFYAVMQIVKKSVTYRLQIKKNKLHWY